MIIPLMNDDDLEVQDDAILCRTVDSEPLTFTTYDPGNDKRNLHNGYVIEWCEASRRNWWHVITNSRVSDCGDCHSVFEAELICQSAFMQVTDVRKAA